MSFGQGSLLENGVLKKKKMNISNLNFRKLINMPLVKIFIILLLGAYIGRTVVYPQPVFWLFVISIVAMVVIFENPKIGMYIMLIWIFLLDWLSLSFFILPRQLTWIKDVVILILLLRTLTLVAKKKEILKTPIDVFLGLFILTGCVSSLINSASPIVVALGFRHALKYILLFYIILYSNFRERFLRKLIFVILLIGFIQIPIAVLEHFLWRPSLMALGAAMNRWDFPTGTLPRGSTGALSLFLISVMCILIGFSIYYKNTKIKPLILVPLLFIPLPFAMSRASFLFLPFIVLFLLMKNVSHRKILRFSYGILLFLIFFGTIYIGSYIVKYDVANWLFNPRLAYMRQVGPPQLGQSVGRVAGIKFVADYLKRDTYNYLFGMGPGMWSESYFTSFTGNIWEKFSEIKVTQANQITWTLAEFGLLGIVFYFLMIYKIYRMNELLFKRVNDNYWKAVSFGFSGIIFLYAMATIYIPIFYWGASAFFFWTLAGAIFSIGTRKGIFEKRGLKA